MVPTNTAVGGGTGFVAAGIVGISGTGYFHIGSKVLKTTASEDASDVIISGRSRITTRDTRENRNRASSNSELEIGNISMKTDWNKQVEKENNKQ